LLSQIDKPTVIDADGLNALVGHLNILLSTRDSRLSTILTPHPGEMARLLNISIKKVQDDRKNIAKRFARDYRVTVVLKGYHTVVTDAKGNLYINRTGNPGMATAGSGDVLTGIIGAFMGQGLDAFSASKYAVYLHGLAGDLAAKEKTQMAMIASDIIDKIPAAIKKCS
jgi:NAD(P)H-hydrate epimerase